MDSLRASLDFALLLRSAEPTSAFENRIRSLISETEAKLVRLDSQIRDLTCQRDHERGTISRLRAMLAPIRKLPIELLTEVFFLVCDDNIYLSSPGKPVLLLSQVCTFWREEVHKTPRCWRNFLTVNGDEDTEFSDQDMDMIQMWLARSAPLPIPIRIWSHAPGTEAVLKSLFPSADRWQSLDVDCNTLSCLADLPPGSLEKLEVLDLWDYDQELPTVDAFLSAPRLRNVTLRVGRTLNFPMPWQQLTTIEITDACPDTCRGILIKCANIVHAIFRTSAWLVNAHVPELPITVLPWLETLKIGFSNLEQHSQSGPFFQPLTLPALKKLDLSDSEVAFWPGVIFTEFQRRSPNIEYSISSIAINSGDLAVLLRHAPTLRWLNLQACWSCVDDNICDALKYREGDVVPLTPALEVLKLRYIREDVSRSCVETMIRSRWWSDEELLTMAAPPKVARWKEVSLEGDVVFSNDFKSWMEVAKMQGLRVTVSRF